MSSLPKTPEELAQQIDDLLPQTQCTQCGYTGCAPYALAIANGQAEINRCPPGGANTISALARLLGRPTIELNPDCGQTIERHIASIDPKHCIGCTLCIKACPVDAIIGSSKRRHAVVAELCTGCELCIPPCPVDCIDMEFIPQHADWSTPMAHQARQRMHQRQSRLLRQQAENDARLEAKAEQKLTHLDQQPGEEHLHKKAAIEAALARARARRQAQPK